MTAAQIIKLKFKKKRNRDDLHRILSNLLYGHKKAIYYNINNNNKEQKINRVVNGLVSIINIMPVCDSDFIYYAAPCRKNQKQHENVEMMYNGRK